jgi:hypothetical protein
MGRLLVVAAVALASVLMTPGAALGSHDASGAPFDQDFVTGEYRTDFSPGGTSGPIRFIYVFDVRSRPDGQNPTGTVREDVESLPLGPGSRHPFLTARVTCLNVTANRATIGLELPPEVPAAARWSLLSVEDNHGAAADRVGSLLIGQAATVCPANPSIPIFPIFGGDIIVHDAQGLPTSKGQCNHDGWKTFGAFKNQGDCVSFVATGGKNPPAGSP